MHLRVFLVCLLLAVPLRGQEPSDYNGWIQRAVQIQEDQAVKDAAAKETVAWKKSELLARNSEKAAAAYEKAAALAPDETAKFDALMKAAVAWENGYATKPRAYETFVEAAKITSVDGAKRAEAALGAAKNLYAWKENPRDALAAHDLAIRHYSDVVKIPGALPKTLKTAYEQLAFLYGREIKSPRVEGRETVLRQPDFALSAQNWEKAAANHEDPKTAEMWFSFATVNLGKSAPDPQLAALLDRVYPRRIELKKQLAVSPADALGWESSLRNDWAKALVQQKAFDRALAVWKLNADNAQLEDKRRFEALEQMAKQQLELKRYADALKTWDAAAKLPNTAFSRAQLIAHGRADVYLAQNNEKKVRELFQTLLAHPAAKPDDAATVWLNIGLSYKRERNSLKAAKATNAQIEAAEKAAITAFASMITPASSPNARYESFFERASIEAEHKRYDAAHSLLAEAVKMENPPAKLLWDVGRNRATLYGQAGQFALAAEMLGAVEVGMGWNGITYQISQPTLTLGEQLFNASIQAKDWAAARKMTDLFGKWGVNSFDLKLRVTRVDIGEGKIDEARRSIDYLQKAYLSQSQKNFLATLLPLLPPIPAAAPSAP